MLRPSSRIAASARKQASIEVFGFSGIATDSNLMSMRPVLPRMTMKCVLNFSAGSATTFSRVRSKPMPAIDSTAAMFTLAGKCGTPSRALPSNSTVAALIRSRSTPSFST